MRFADADTQTLIKIRHSFCLFAFNFAVSEANLPPHFTADLNNHIIIESTPVGTPVYTLRGVDPEKSELKYGIMGTDKLVVDEVTGIVTIAKPIDREVSNTLKVTVTVEDVVDEPGQENNLVKLPVSVIVQDLNDNAPKFENKVRIRLNLSFKLSLLQVLLNDLF